jgi:hypothetical protein
MTQKSVNKYIIILLFLFISPAAHATAESEYRAGVEAYKSGDNAAALKFFESAQAQGMNSIALKYNLASSYYRMGKLTDAKLLFEQLLENEAMRELANYHLGQIAIEMQDHATAVYHFEKVVASGQDEKLAKLSQKYLDILSKEEPRWQSYISFNLGYDDNINSVSGDSVLDHADSFAEVSGDSVLDQADSFAELSAATDYLLSGQRKDGWLVGANFQGIEYRDTDNNDLAIVSAGIKRAIRLSFWETSANLLLSKSTYGSEDFQTITRLEIIGKNALTRRQRLYLRYRAEDIKSDNALYDYLQGWRQQGRIEYRHYAARNIKYLYYELELNDRGQLVTSTDAYEYSPTRHTIRGIYTQVIRQKWWLTADVAYRISEFDPTATIDRTDDQWNLGLGLEYQFDRTFRLTTRYQRIANSSTIDRYTYDKSIIKVGLSKLF